MGNCLLCCLEDITLQEAVYYRVGLIIAKLSIIFMEFIYLVWSNGSDLPSWYRACLHKNVGSYQCCRSLWCLFHEKANCYTIRHSNSQNEEHKIKLPLGLQLLFWLFHFVMILYHAGKELVWFSFFADQHLWVIKCQIHHRRRTAVVLIISYQGDKGISPKVNVLEWLDFELITMLPYSILTTTQRELSLVFNFISEFYSIGHGVHCLSLENDFMPNLSGKSDKSFQ